MPTIHATPSTIAPSTIAEPRSPCISESPAAIAARRPTYIAVRRESPSSSLRRVRRSAAAITTAILRNSAGWRENPPILIQDRAPLTVAPIPGASGPSIAMTAPNPSGMTILRHRRYGTRAVITIPMRPRTAQDA